MEMRTRLLKYSLHSKLRKRLRHGYNLGHGGVHHPVITQVEYLRVMQEKGQINASSHGWWLENMKKILFSLGFVFSLGFTIW